MSTLPWPDHLLTLAEWAELPSDGLHRYELVEGVLRVVPGPTAFHQRAMLNLGGTLQRQLPPDLSVIPDVDIVVDAGHPATVRAPDLVVVPSAVADLNPPRFNSPDVLLAVEILSPGTRRTDRVTKAFEYADAGIPAYWIVDLEGPATLTAFTLVDGEYEIVAQSDGTVELSAPAPVVIDVEALTRR